MVGVGRDLCVSSTPILLFLSTALAVRRPMALSVVTVNRRDDYTQEAIENPNGNDGLGLRALGWTGETPLL